MNLMKAFMLFAIILFFAIAYKTYEQEKQIVNSQNLIILNESETLSKFVLAFRKTYQDIFIREHIVVDKKNINFLPVKTIPEISKRFSKSLNGDISIRTVSDRPRNINNMANDFEIAKIEYFRNNPNKKDNFIQKDDGFYYTKPLYIEKSCLKCHGKRENAIPSIRYKYDKAYDYVLGDIRGLVSIKIKNRDTFKAMYSNFIITTVYTLLLYMIFIIIIYSLIKKIANKEKQYVDNLEININNKVDEIRKQKEAFEMLFEKSSDGITIMYKNKFIQCNDKIVKLLKFESKEELLGQTPLSLSPELQPDGRKSIEKSKEMIDIAIKEGWNNFEWLHRKANDDTFMAEITLTSLVLDGKDVIYVVWKDISYKKESDNKLLEQKEILHHQATHDALTGLPNRVLFTDRLKHGIEVAKRKNSKLAVLFIDLDHFKTINDSLGHQIGDKVLILVTERLRSKVRKEDTVARLGGDEFTIVMEDLNTIQDVSILSKKVLDTLSKPMYIDTHTLYVSCSIGISLYPQDGMDSMHMLKYADAAMYKAKDEGKNNFQFYSSEMTKVAFERVLMETYLREALEKKEFIVYYQPQVYASSNGKLAGVEALLRWHHPTMGLIYPDKFISLAEETGLIIEIDRWVMKTAMTQLAIWHKRGFNPGVLALNLSMRQLSRKDFIDTLKKSMESTDFRASWLELEITESQVMQKAEESIEKLNEISKLGIELAIDDFGTGYSSLSYLKRLPVDTLKIDQSFIKNLPYDKEDISIINAVIALANSLNLKIVAEGVETEEQKDFIVESGCQYIQGNYFSKAVSAAVFENKFLIKN